MFVLKTLTTHTHITHHERPSGIRSKEQTRPDTVFGVYLSNVYNCGYYNAAVQRLN